MLIDITLRITPKMATDAQGNERKAMVGHLGTHFDVMDKDFPLEFTRRRGIVFDVADIGGRDIDIPDIELSKVEGGMFVAFRTGFIESQGYGGKVYFSAHPQLSNALIDALLDRNVSIIGVDFAGIRRGGEHTPADQRCANRGAFVIENFCNLKAVVEAGGACVMHTYPMNFAGMTGLPCRVIAEM